VDKIIVNIMKKYKFLWLILPCIFILSACSKDDNNMTPGNPMLNLVEEISSAFFGDSLQFIVEVSDNVPLSILNACLYFGDEKVSETTIRTKTDGEYTGKLFIPYYANIPNGVATLMLMLKDTHLSSVTKSFNVNISRPDYPYLILVTSNTVYSMERVGLYQYAATEAFPSSELSAYIKTPVVTRWGNEVTFGWEGGSITQGSTNNIPFTSDEGGKYSVTFNTLTYQAAPFFEILFNNQKMEMLDKENFKIDVNLTKGQEITFSGINIADWWIDPDYLIKVSDNRFTFVPGDGKYRVTANTKFRYFKVEVMSGNDLATLQPDGTGAIWVIGQDVGKPSVADNEVGWNTDKALCMAPIGNKKYQLTLVGGQTVNTHGINFKFFHQKGWGGEFGGDDVTSTSDLIYPNPGPSDSGNLRLFEGKTLEYGATYVFVLDVSGGNTNAVLSVTKK